ncbi:Piso0_000010 [Millerozyma farinosa CBS 7064]|uniref:Piso0_000010 protein n=1 Tax=Pichia sorbitophila (strain ATCC MYA-4447 / BCRC 22081 / CBS 7064 / NBRC 10061 / NRRL Y-12695) TaxID=559304 RepID=G8YSV0_PICSO|nr:Piso0_000010 [Millerozyma farinosa CBS 7064]
MNANRKRHRISSVCTNCRARKVRCDRRKPCIQCVKHKTSDTCEYESKFQEFYPSLANNEPSLNENVQYTFQNLQEKERPIESDTTPSFEASSKRVLRDNRNINYQVDTPNESATRREHLENIIKDFKDNLSRLEMTLEKENKENDIGRMKSVHNSNEFDFKSSINQYKYKSSRVKSLLRPNIYQDGNERLIYPLRSDSCSSTNIPLQNPVSWYSLVKNDFVFFTTFSYVQSKQITFLDIIYGQEKKKDEQRYTTNNNPSSSRRQNNKKRTRLRYRRTFNQNNDVLTNDIASKLNERLRKKSNTLITIENATGSNNENIIEPYVLKMTQGLLPNKETFDFLIKRFFTHVYPFVPLVDENDVKSHISKVLNFESDNTMIVEPTGPVDMAALAIIFILIRLASLSLSMSSTKTSNDDNVKHTQVKGNKFKVSVKLVHIAQIFLDQFPIASALNITVFQGKLLLKSYHELSPENGDNYEWGSLHLFNNFLIQTAYFMGLNRKNTETDTSLPSAADNLAKKLWFYLLKSNLLNSCCQANSMAIDITSYDAPLPSYDVNSNVRDSVVEKAACMSYASFYELDKILNGFVHMSSNVRLSPLVKDVVYELDKLEEFIMSKYPNVNDYMKPMDPNHFFHSSVKAMEFKDHLHLTSLCLSCYYQLYIFYETKNIDLSYFYLRKIILTVTEELLPNLHDCISNIASYFGESSMILLNPFIQILVHKCNKILFLLLARVNLTIYGYKKENGFNKLESLPTNIKLMCMISCALMNCFSSGLSIFKRLSSQYYYAWKIFKTQSFFLNIIVSEDYYERYYKEIEEGGLRFSDAQLQELVIISRNSLRALSKSKFFTAEEMIAHILKGKFGPSVIPSDILAPLLEENGPVEIDTSFSNDPESKTSEQLEDNHLSDIYDLSSVNSSDFLWSNILRERFENRASSIFDGCVSPQLYDTNISLENEDSNMSSWNDKIGMQSQQREKNILTEADESKETKINSHNEQYVGTNYDIEDFCESAGFDFSDFNEFNSFSLAELFGTGS